MGEVPTCLQSLKTTVTNSWGTAEVSPINISELKYCYELMLCIYFFVFPIGK